MAEIQEDGQLFLSDLEIHVLETEFFQFERALNEDPDHEIRSRLLKLKWDHLMLKERLKVLERDPVNQKSPLTAKD